jgi:hypothetical protein
MNQNTLEMMPVQEKLSMKYAEIGIPQDSHNDIFSDLDTSPYAEQTLSDDFIIPANKLSKDKDGRKISLKLLLLAIPCNGLNENGIIKGSISILGGSAASRN